MADVGVDLLLEAVDDLAKLRGQAGQGRPVDDDADRLHSSEDRDQGQLDLGIQAGQALRGEAPLEGLPDGHRAERLEPGPGRVAEVPGRRQDQVELFGDHIGDRLAAERGVEDVGRDLGVEGDRHPGGGLVVRDPGDEDRLDLVADDRGVARLEDPADRRDGLDALDGDRPSVHPGEGKGKRAAHPRPRVVEQVADADGRLIGDPGRQPGDVVETADLDPGRVLDGRGQGLREVLDRLPRARPAILGGGARRGRGHRPEVEGELELRAALRPSWPGGRPTGCPVVGPRLGSGRPRRPDRAPGDDLAEGLGRGQRILAAQRRQALDQGPELVFAKQPDDALAVVGPDPGAGQVQLDVRGGHEAHQLAALEDRLSGGCQRFAKLGRLELVEPLVHRIEGAEGLDEFRGGLLADAGDTGDVVGRIALEGLVVEHLVRAQAPALVDLRQVVGDRVRDPATQRDHQGGPIGDELEHVQVAGEDGRVEVCRLGLADERRDDVVGLVALALVLRDAEGLDDLADFRDLVSHVVRHPGPGRLVLEIALVAERRRAEVEGDRDVVGLHVGHGPEDDVREAEHRVHELALRRGQGRLEEGEVAAIDEPVAVEQHQAFGGHERSVPAAPAALRGDGGGRRDPWRPRIRRRGHRIRRGGDRGRGSFRAGSARPRSPARRAG